MNAVSNSFAQEKLEDIMEQVCNDHLPIIITRPSQPSVVLISLEDYQSLEETAYLLRSPKNAEILLESISALEKGQGLEQGLLD